MYCPHCGTENPDGASFCVECAKPLGLAEATVQLAQPLPDAVPSPPVPPPTPAASQVKVQSYMVPAILVTLFCCLPGGIVAIAYAAQVNAKVQAGDHSGAQSASEKAKKWTIGSVVVGLVVYFLVILGSGEF